MNQPLKILHLEDLPSDADLVARELKAAGLAGQIFLAENRDEFIRGLTEFGPDIILSDHSLPSFDSHDALKIVKDLGIEVPFILITATVSEEYAVNIMKEGASDYILKDRLQRLPSAINAAIDSNRLKAASRQAIETLRSSERKHKLLFQSNPLPMWMVSRTNLAIIDVNKAAVRHYGYSREEFLSIHEEDLLASGDELTPVLSGTLHHKRKDGTVITVELIAHEVLYEDEPVCLVLAHDITEKLRVETELARQRALQQKLIAETSITVQEREREEIGKELHDNINQLLAVAKLYLQHAMKKDDLRSDGLLKCRENIDSAIEEIRKLSQVLVAPSLGDTTLTEAIRGLVQLVSLTTSLELELNTDDYQEELLNKNIKLALYRVVQEQMNNVMKHARAKKVFVEIKTTGGFVYLTIRDDGIGFDPDRASGGIGLRNISNRAGCYDGTVKIVSSPGRGCTMKVSIPIGTKNSEEQDLRSRWNFLQVT